MSAAFAPASRADSSHRPSRARRRPSDRRPTRREQQAERHVRAAGGRAPGGAPALPGPLIRGGGGGWKRPRVLLTASPRAAAALPFLVTRLSPPARAKIAGIALLGLEGLIDFKYHPSWIPFYHPHDPERPVRPEVDKLRGLKVLCVYGAQEKSSICPALDPHSVQTLRTPGHHHFAGHYVEVDKAILAAAK